MGRKTKDTVEYFPFVIKDGKTLFVLQRKYGLAGIGFFTQVMRMLGQTPGHYYVYVDEYEKDRLNAFCGLSESDVRAMLTDMAKTGKIDPWLWEHRDVIYSQAFVDELEELYRKRKTEVPTRDTVIGETQYLEKVKTPADSGGFQESADFSGFPPESAELVPESADFREHSIGEDRRVEDSMSAPALDQERDSPLSGEDTYPATASEARKPRPMPPLKDPIAAKWEKALTDIQPPDTWSSVPKERKQCGELAKKTPNMLSQSPFATSEELIQAVIAEYRRLKGAAKTTDTYWRNAAYTPSAVLTRFPEIWQSLAQRYETHEKQAAYAESLQEVTF